MKYIIEFEDEPSMVEAGLRYYQCKQVPYWGVSHGIIKNLTPYTEPDCKAIDLQHAHDIENVARMNYSKGAEDAWELSRRIICPSDCCEDSISAYTKEIFNKDGWEIRGIFNDLSYQDAKTKYEAWKKKKEEIRVGDEVVLYENVKMVVVQVDHGTSIQGVDENGECYERIERNVVKKTGRHFDEIETLLKKMNEG